MNKKILITGASGFTAPYVEKVFKDHSYDVYGMTQFAEGDKQLACDLTDKEAINQLIDELRPDGIIHLAALSFVGHDDPEEFYRVNVLGVTNLLDAVVDADYSIDKIIIASSANIYGTPDNIISIHEGVCPAPVNHYATSKLAMECMTKTYFDKLPLVITRPFNYTGPGQRGNFLIPKIVSHFRDSKELIELGNLDVSRDFTDVRDIAQAYFSLYESPASSEVVNLCSGKAYELKSVIEMMNEIADYEIEVRVNPAFVRDNEIKVLSGDNSHLMGLTGFKPSIDFKQTLQDMYNA